MEESKLIVKAGDLIPGNKIKNSSLLGTGMKLMQSANSGVRLEVQDHTVRSVASKTGFLITQ